MTPGASILMTTFAVWAVASLLVQADTPTSTRLRRIDALHLVPKWRFFAPTPITSDHLVSYRAWHADGGCALDWTRTQVPGRRRLLDSVCNLTRRSRKAQRVACSYLLRHPSDDRFGVPISTPSYLLLLGLASRECAREAPTATVMQFRVTRVESYHLKPIVVSSFLSAKHLL